MTSSPSDPRPELSEAIDRLGEALEAFRAAGSMRAEAELRERRNALVTQCLEATGADLRWLGGGPRIDLLLGTMRAGLRVQPLGDDEAALLARARAGIAAAGGGAEGVERMVAATLAFCLLRPADALPRLPEWGAVPVDLLDLLVRPLYVEPEFLVGPGEAERAADHLERLTLGILAAVESDLPLAARRELATRMVFHGRFLMGYFSERNLRPLYRARARVIEFCLESAGHVLDADFPPPPPGPRRLRVGLLRPGWATGAETAAVLAHINRLDRDRFELVAYTLADQDNPVQRLVRERAERFTVLNGQSVAEAVRQVRADELDLLLIGTNITATTHFLVLMSAFRLARTQVALTLNPATTGFRSVDVFLNGAANEPEGGQDDYTERLLLIPGPINHYDFTGEPVPGGVPGGRAALGLPEDAFIFASGANFYKLVPELLESWCRILRAVPAARLVLYPFNPNWINVYPVGLFSRHLRGVLAQHGVAPERLHILRPMPSRAHIHALLRSVDVYLDSFPYSGAVSVLDPATAGCPIVMRAGRPARNRQSAGFHAGAGLGAVVTGTVEEYERAAVRLADDRAALTDLRVRALDARSRVGTLTALDLAPALLELAGGAARDVSGTSGAPGSTAFA